MSLREITLLNKSPVQHSLLYKFPALQTTLGTQEDHVGSQKGNGPIWAIQPQEESVADPPGVKLLETEAWVVPLVTLGSQS